MKVETGLPCILFVDDHPIYRDGFRRTLEANVPGASVRVAAGQNEALEMLAADSAIDLCLSDLRLIDGDGLSLIAAVRKAYPSIAVGILCGEPTAALSADVRALGGVACMAKDMDTEDLVAAIETIAAGDEVFQPAGPPLLSQRRRAILTFASQGMADKRICEHLGVTESTVRNHWHHIFRRLGVTNRTEAVTQALRQKLI